MKENQLFFFGWFMLYIFISALAILFIENTFRMLLVVIGSALCGLFMVFYSLKPLIDKGKEEKIKENGT